MEANQTRNAQANTAEMRTLRMTRGLEFVMVAIVIALAFMLASFAVRNSDFWMQLATGRLISEGKYEFGKDPFSFATAGKYWVNHSWLYDYALYQIYNLNDDHSAVVYAKAGVAALLALVMLLAGRAMRRKSPASAADPTGWLAGITAAVGLIAISTSLTMRPIVLSMLFLAITFWALNESRDWSVRKLAIVLGALFAIWANVDAWFFLGPITVLLFLAGEALQGYLPRSQPAGAARLKQLQLALAVGLGACLVNPHHYHVFTDLPTEIHTNVVASMKSDPLWEWLFISPLNPVYQKNPGMGDSIPGACYAALILLSIAGFGMNLARTRASWLLTFIAAIALSFLNWRLIPFFAVVAVPITILNFRSFFARQFAMADAASASAGKESSPADASLAATAVPPVAPTNSADSTAITANPPEPQTPRETWWPGAADAAAPAAVAPAPKQEVRRGEITMSPTSLLAFAGVMGRVLTVVGLLGLLVVAYPGWLHATPPRAANIRRVCWDLEPEQAFVEVAKKIGEWNDKGLLPADSHGLVFHMEIADYIAWYAPGVQTFMDSRLPLVGSLSGDFMTVRRGLNEWKDDIENPQDWKGVLHRRGIKYLILTNDLTSGERLLPTMMLRFQEWSMWYQNGVTAVFGWNDPESPREKDPLRQDLVQMAFGPSALRVTSAQSVGVSRDRPAEDAAERTFFDRLLQPPPPQVPPESESALLFIALQNASRGLAYGQAQQSFMLAEKLAASISNSLLTDLPLTDESLQALHRNMSSSDAIPMAIGLLAVREARLGAIAHPNDGFPALILGYAYGYLPSASKTLRDQEQVSIFHQGLDRITPEEIEGNRLAGSLATTAWITLANGHQRHGERDLAEECYVHALAMFDKHPPLLVPEKDLEKYKENVLQRPLEKLQGDLLPARDQFKSYLDDAQRRNVPLTEQVDKALAYGLAREALKILEESSSEAADPGTISRFVKLYLAVGRVAAAQNVLNRAVESSGEQMQSILMPVQINVWNSAGEYGLAGKALEEVLEKNKQADDPRIPFIRAALIFERLHFSVVEMAAQALRYSTAPFLAEYIGTFQQLQAMKAQKSVLLSMRAMLALEEGDIPKARQYFKETVDVGVPAPEAAAYLSHIERAAKAAQQPAK
jgi:hypothetical protein